MEIIVIVEPTVGGFRARCRHPVEAEATGSSSYDARLALEKILQAKVNESFSTLPLDVTPDKPWIATAGSIPDDAITAEWLAAIAEYRRERDRADQQILPSAPLAQPLP